MYTPIPTIIGQAVQYFQQGDLEQSQALLAKVLKTEPRNFDALHIGGVIRAMQGRRSEAIELFRKALSINKKHSFLQFNIAKALSESGNDEEALIHHKWATQLAPNHAEAWLNFGHSLLNLGRYDEATAALEKAKAINPGYAAAWCNLGLSLHKQGKNNEALAAIDKAIALQPDLAEAYNNKGIVFDESDQSEEALRCYQQALQVNPNYTEALLNTGIKLADLNRHEDALRHLDQAIALDASAQAWNYKATSQLALGQADEAKASYRQALAIQPDHADAEANLGQLLLQTGDFEAGWEMLEKRWESKDQPLKQIQTRRPRWTGSATDQPVLLWGEQGIGDQVLYGSILSELSIFPQKKIVALDKRLLALFARSMPNFDFIDLAQVNDDLDFGLQLPLGSLPKLFRPTKESFLAAHHPYLRADKDRTEALRAKIARPGKIVCGVSWSSNRKILGKHKSISLEQLLPPLASDDVHFVNLQYGDTTAERQSLQEKFAVTVQNVDEIDTFNDLDGLAALISACDLVISTSNTTVHLAGALGKTVLLLLPCGKRKIWYWSEFDGKNLWYPSIHSFTQIEPGQWTQPIDQLRQYIESKSWN